MFVWVWGLRRMEYLRYFLFSPLGYIDVNDVS